MDKETINQVIIFLKQSLLNKGISVDSIALFGSSLTGNMNEDSDIDLLVVSSDFRNLDIFERAKLTMIPEIETMKKFKIPMDIINLSPEEFLDSDRKMMFKSKVVA